MTHNPIPTPRDPEDLSAYYFPEHRQLQVYARTEQVLRQVVDQDDDETDYWQGFQYGGAEYDANLSRPGEDSPFCLSIYPVENGQTQTGRSLPVTFSERKSPFHVGDKVRFTEEAIALVIRSFGSDEVSEFMTQVYRESEYIVEDISASPEYDHNIITVRHSAEDDSRGIAEYNLTKK